jgi:hypothetical protein
MPLKEFICRDFFDGKTTCPFFCVGHYEMTVDAGVMHLVEEHGESDSPLLRLEVEEVIVDYSRLPDVSDS